MLSLLSVEQRGDVTLVRSKSSVLDYYSSEQLGKELELLTENILQPSSILNFDNVRYISACCLGKLTGLYKNISRKGGRIKFCCVNGIIYELFKTVGFDRLFEIYHTEEEAIKNCHAPRRRCA